MTYIHIVYRVRISLKRRTSDIIIRHRYDGRTVGKLTVMLELYQSPNLNFERQCTNIWLYIRINSACSLNL